MEGLRPPNTLSFQNDIAENWKRWRQAFSIYSAASGLKSKDKEIQVATFLHVIGEEALEKFNTFELTESQRTDLDQIIAAFNAYCIPKSNESVERHIFFSRSQQEDEPFDVFVTDLRKLSLSCGFEQLKDGLIRDRIIGGIRSKQLRGRLLKEDALTLETCVRLCKASELVDRQTKLLEKDTNVIAAIKGSRTTQSHGNEATKSGNTRNEQRSKSSWEKRKRTACLYCGEEHARFECPAYGVTCSICKRKHHFAKMCKRKTIQSLTLREEEEQSSEGESIYINTVNNNTGESESEWHEYLKLSNNKLLKVKLDTGAQCNVLTWEAFKTLNLDSSCLKMSNKKLMNYEGSKIDNIGKCSLTCTTKKGITDQIEFQVVKTRTRIPSLLGLKTLTSLKLIKRVDELSTKSLLLTQYSDLFKGIGEVKNYKYEIKLVKNAVGKIEPGRKIPQKIRQQLKEELTSMEKKGIIRKVEGPTEWVNSLVIVKKSNKLRICLDPRHLNKNIQREHYQLPTFEEIAGRLCGAKVFSVLDASKGFWQIRLHKQSEELTTFNTPLGRYCYKRLPYGLNSAPEVFHRVYTDLFKKVDGVEIYIDDILVWGRNEEEHDKRLEQVLLKARENNIKFNKAKCKIRVPEVKYLGHTFSKEGLKPDDSKIKAIMEWETPKNRKELERMLGLVTYIAKFIPNLSQKTVKLRELLRKNVLWSWNKEHEDEFTIIKKTLTEQPVLQLYNEKEPIILSVDASQEGLGAVLLQNNLPVAYSSKSLSEVQKQYAQIEKETLAILYGAERFRQYLYGRDFVVESDHKPLETIFKKPLNQCPLRLQRMLIRLQEYEFTVTYKPGTNLKIADALSRVKGTDKETDLDMEVEAHVAMLTTNLRMSEQQIKRFQKETEADEELQLLKKHIKGEYKTPQVKHVLGKYTRFPEEIFEANGLMFKNESVIVPRNLRKEMLRRIHCGHMGIEKCKLRARNVLYWPHMNKEIEDIITNCDICLKHRRKQTKESLIQREVPNGPWKELGTDLFYYKGKDFIIVVDYYSKYVEVDQLNDLTADTTIQALKKIFARHGRPDLVYSDNGPQFSNRNFKAFARDWEFTHKTSSPTYPQSNGMIERYIQTVKNMWRKVKQEGGDPYIALLEYKNTPITSLIPSPNEILYGRRVAGFLPHKDIGPKKTTELLQKRQINQKKHYDSRSKSLKPLSLHDQVYMKDPSQSENSPRIAAKIIGEADRPRSYRVITEQGKLLERNRRDLIKRPNNTHLVVTKEEDLAPEEEVKGKREVKKEQEEKLAEREENEQIKCTRSGRVINTPNYLKDYELDLP